MAVSHKHCWSNAVFLHPDSSLPFFSASPMPQYWAHYEILFKIHNAVMTEALDNREKHLSTLNTTYLLTAKLVHTQQLLSSVNPDNSSTSACTYAKQNLFDADTEEQLNSSNNNTNRFLHQLFGNNSNGLTNSVMTAALLTQHHRSLSNPFTVSTL